MDINWQKIKENLPDRPGIMGDKIESAVLVPIIKIDGEYKFVFQKRAHNVRQPGEISFPGGRYEKKDINFKETAIRETVEEMGIKREKINIIGQMDIVMMSSGYVIYPYVGFIDVDSLEDFNINKKEVEQEVLIPVSYFIKNKPEKYVLDVEIKTTRLDESGKEIKLFPVKSLNLPKKYHGNWKGREIPVYLYKYKNEVIWGITAEILKEIVNIIDNI